MKRLRCLIPSEVADGLAEALMRAGALAVDIGVSQSPPDTADHTPIQVYCNPPDVAYLQQVLETALLKRLDPTQVSGLMTSQRVEVVDDSWQTKWTESLRPVELLPDLLLVPEGAAHTSEPGVRIMVVETGLVFGFGEHPTTRLMSAWLKQQCSDTGLAETRVLDVGTGTGVLAFVAAHLGAKRTVGIDVDPASVAAAQRNADRNGWQTQCFFAGTPLAEVEERFDIVVANIDALTLQQLSPAIVSRLLPGAVLALTGVLQEQALDVVQTFKRLGVSLSIGAQQAEWVLLESHSPA